MPRQPLILVVDDEPNIRRTLESMLALEDYRTAAAASGSEALGRLERQRADLVLLDLKLPDQSGLELMRAMAERQIDAPVVVMSGHATVETAVQAVQLGALDFLEKPLTAERTLVSVASALERSRLVRENASLRQEVGIPDPLVGSSAAIERVRTLIAQAAPTDGRVLILGESGTGKELVARALHAGSPRDGAPLVVVNCAAVPAELLESELFGHEKGAFTGALKRRIGRFETADGGTLFLDEIGDMPLTMQPKLLRVLEDGVVERLGGGNPVTVDVRVIAATNQDLTIAVDSGRFRADLYHRLHVVPIQLPPLRDRLEDLAPLAEHFALTFEKRHGRRIQLTAAALEAMAVYSWPGNVRELRNIVERLVILGEAGPVDAGTMHPLLPEPRSTDPAGSAAVTDFREAVRRFEHRHITRVLAATNGVVAEAARQLGLERSYLYKKMRDLGIDRG